MLQGVQLHLVENFADAEALISWLGTEHHGPMALDCETTGIDKMTDRIRLFQIGDAYQGWAVPFEEWKGLVRTIVDRWDGRWVGHNVRFDWRFLKNHGIDVPQHRIDDSMMASHIANPTHSIGLKQQASRHIDPIAAAAQSQLDQVMHSGNYSWATIPITPDGPCKTYWVYGALDCVLTRRLWDHHRSVVTNDAPKAYDLELATGWLADRMERKGALVDREYTTAQRSELSGMFDQMTRQGYDEFGVNLSSADQVVKSLLADNVPLWKRTDSGAWSLDKFALEGIAHPLAKLLQRRKFVEKLNSTYLRRFLEYSEHDGRLHPNINTLGFSEQSAGAFGVVTSRMSMSNPNLQQLPRVGDDPLSKIARNCIVASPGHTLVLFDFDQIELRLMAHLSNDPGLAEAFTSDNDFFVELTRKIYQDETITKKDARRNLTKSYTYATLYGAGNDKLATTTKRPLTEIERLDADFNRAYEGVPKFQRDIQDLAARRLTDEGMAYVRSSLTGRRFIARDNDKLYQLVNSNIQGMAAEIMKSKLLELDAAGLGDVLELVVHDEAIAEVPDAEVSDAIATFTDVMNDDSLLSIPLTAGGATAKRWADKTDI